MQNNSVSATNTSNADNPQDVKSVIGKTEKTLVPLSFKVPKEFKKRYQRAAIDSLMSFLSQCLISGKIKNNKSGSI